ncbi:biosynthetic arginine decarboxylase [Ectothiorhodospiraceae bacterium BW-2]|nr:biosynthetic arginine decarboxylase [Ectothiorhodospiraceae bacterium BW-2]
MSAWCAAKNYNIANWSEGYFAVNAQGELTVLPQGSAGEKVTLTELCADLQSLSLQLPVVIRFPDILHHRLQQLTRTFEQVMAASGYQGCYQPLYPIKVNQQHSVVRALQQGGGGRLGLEAGSKGELLAVLGLSQPGSRVVCNGFKDREYIRLALIGLKLGIDVTLIIEKLSELDLVLDEAQKLQLQPRLGVRVRLTSRGAGKWQNSGGTRAKFGLTTDHLFILIKRLRQQQQLASFYLLHTHIGSQVANIHDIQQAVREMSRFYVELRKLGVPVSAINMGGGLGIDYDGSRSSSYNSINYTLQHYAEALVQPLLTVCRQHQLPHPEILTESGRGLTAHHALLLTEVIDSEIPDTTTVPAITTGAAEPLLELYQALQQIGQRSVVDIHYDAMTAMEGVQQHFLPGLITLQQRADAEQLYRVIAARLMPQLDRSQPLQADIYQQLQQQLVGKYFCNLSIFQSLPDIWGIEQIFPIMPVSGLKQPPSQRVVLEDLTCDSDGRIDHYIDDGRVEPAILLPPLVADKPTILAIFLVGAYQEILGDIHNLFGDTHVVDVAMEPDGRYRLVNTQQGDTIAELLHYLHFDSELLLEHYRQLLQQSGVPLEQQHYFYNEFKHGLSGYTYFEEL